MENLSGCHCWVPLAEGYVRDVSVLSREEFDAMEFDAACTGEHQAAAERMASLATTGTESLSMPRAEAFVRAGEQWLLADNAWEAAWAFRMAIADGGPVEVDPRVPLCRALFQLGDDDEARAMLGALKSAGAATAQTCELVTELLVEQSDLPGALSWADTGVELLLRGSRRNEPGTDRRDKSGLENLLRLRYRIRNDLRLPEDGYDRMLSD